MMDGIKQKFKGNFEIIFIVVVLLIQTGLYINLLGRMTKLEKILLPQLESPDIALEKAPDIRTDGEFIRGDENSKITIVEFGDYQCPFCAQLNLIITEILDEYNGSVRFVFKDFPLSGNHPQAMQAAEAAHCAGTQGKYWEMHDLLFLKQYDLTHEKLIQYGNELGLNLDQYKSCIETLQFRNDIQSDIDEGVKYKVSGTPVLYINGQRVDNWTIDFLRDHIEVLMKQDQ